MLAWPNQVSFITSFYRPAEWGGSICKYSPSIHNHPRCMHVSLDMQVGWEGDGGKKGPLCLVHVEFLSSGGHDKPTWLLYWLVFGFFLTTPSLLLIYFLPLTTYYLRHLHREIHLQLGQGV